MAPESHRDRPKRVAARMLHVRCLTALRNRLFGLLLALAIAGCATTPREEAIGRMTGFELEVLGKLEMLRKGMTPEQVMDIMGPGDDGSLFQEAARYWVLSTRPIVAELPQPAKFDSIESCIARNGGLKVFFFAKDAQGRLPAGTYRCVVDSPAGLTHWHGVLAAELPAGARLETPVNPKERDAVAKLVFAQGRLSKVYLIHPAPSPRGAFYYVVME